MPAATYFMPSRTMAWASTVAVVVPSPDDGDGEVAAHLVPVQGPGSSPHADAEPTGVYVQTLTMVLDAGDPNETADYYGQRHDHHAGESVVEPAPGEECKGSHEHHVAGEHP